MFNKTGKKCPNGSKSHKYKDKIVCKKNTSVKLRSKENSPQLIQSLLPPSPLEPLAPLAPLAPLPSSTLPNGMFIKTGKKCPNGSKSHKYKDKIVCKNNISVKLHSKEKTPQLIQSLLPHSVSPLPDGMIIKIGKRCQTGYKTHKYKNVDVCKKNI